MAKHVLFLDSVQQSDGSFSPVYTAADINQITKNLVGGGVAPFPTQSTYSTTRLNNLTEALVTSGVSNAGLEVSLDSSGKKINISAGIAYFSNGATIRIDSSGYSLDYTVAPTVYVTAQYDESENICDIYATTTLPNETDTLFVVELASISSDGTITDLRKPALMKVASDAPHVIQKVENFTGDTLVATSSSFNNVFIENASSRHFSYFNVSEGRCIFGRYGSSDFAGMYSDGKGRINFGSSDITYTVTSSGITFASSLTKAGTTIILS